MTEKEFIKCVNEICELKFVSGEFVAFISNDVETVEFLTGKKTFIEACKELVNIADDYKVEQIISETIKESYIPEAYINISYLRQQTTIIKDKLTGLKELIMMYLDL